VYQLRSSFLVAGSLLCSAWSPLAVEVGFFFSSRVWFERVWSWVA
jgi:hypothetical protein